jgi:hypothetical protein
VSKKIIISESQYRRVFLGEQQLVNSKPPKYSSWSSHSIALGCGACSYDSYKKLALEKDGYVLPYKEVKSGDYSIDTTPYGGELKKPGIVFDPMTGDQKWDYGDSFKLKHIHRDFVDTYNNAYNKLKGLKSYANWDGKSVLVDDVWLKKNGSNLQNVLYPDEPMISGIENTDIYNPDWLLKKHEELRSAAEVDLLTLLKQETFKRKIDQVQKKYSDDYSQYEKDFAVWKKNFESINRSQERFDSNEKQKLNWIDYESGSLLPKQNTPIYDFKPKFDLNNPFGKSTTNTDDNDESLSMVDTKWVKPLKPKNVKEFQDWLDIYHPKWMDGGRLDKGPGYGRFGPRTTKAWSEYGYLYQANKDGVIPAAPEPPKVPKISSLSDRTQSDLSDIESTIKSIELLLSAINEVNKKLDSQNKGDIGEFCYGTKNKNVPGGQMYGWIKYPSLSWSKYCNDGHGGVWVYSQGKNSKACGCVSTPDQDNIGDINFNPAKKLEHTLETTDIRGTFEKIEDWVDDCLGDWHCVADVASIAVLFLPIPGVNVALSAAIDLVSGVGYMVEGEEGWELNAGLTLLGGAFSGWDAYKFANRAVQGGKSAVKWGQSLNDIVADANKLKSDPNFSKLSKAEQNIQWSNTVKNNLSKLSSKELQDLTKAITLFNKDGAELLKGLKDIMTGIKGLTSSEKVGLENLIKKMSKNPDIKNLVIKEIVDNGGKVDIKKILRKFAPNITKDALVQSTLFVFMQKYPEETAKFIIGGLELFRELTGIDLLKKLSNHDKDTEDSETESIEEIILQFQNYEKGVNLLLSYLKSTDQKEIKDKYGVDLYDLYGMVFNKTQPLFPDQLIELTNLINSFITDVNSKENENPPESPENIKLFVKEQFDLLKQFIEDDRESEQNLKELWDIYKNNPPKDADLYFDNYEDYRQLQKDIELLDNM